MCFITAGMGGGTGTGAAPIIAQAARELGVLTVGVVTKPFQFEGAKRMRQAEEGVDTLQKMVDTLIIIPNQNLFRLANENTTFTEAFALADKLGLDRQAMFDVVSTSSGYSWTMNAYCPAPGVGPQSPADNDYQPGFAAELMLKDLRLAQAAAEMVDADTPLGRAAEALYETFVEAEDGRGRDFSAMLPRFERRGRS